MSNSFQNPTRSRNRATASLLFLLASTCSTSHASLIPGLKDERPQNPTDSIDACAAASNVLLNNVELAAEFNLLRTTYLPDAVEVFNVGWGTTSAIDNISVGDPISSVETYTWEVMPEAFRSGDVVDQVEREYGWVLEEFFRCGLQR